jgi:hypothetical protein
MLRCFEIRPAFHGGRYLQSKSGASSSEFLQQPCCYNLSCLLCSHANACAHLACCGRLLQVLKEQIRRYKQRAQDAERQAEKQEQKVQSLSDAVRKLKAQLAEGGGSPEAAAAAEAQLRQQAEATAKALEVRGVPVRVRGAAHANAATCADEQKFAVWGAYAWLSAACRQR